MLGGTFASVAHRRIIDWRASAIGRNRGRFERKRRLIGGIGRFFDVKQRSRLVEVPANLSRKFAVESLDLGDPIGRRFANPLEAAEMTEERTPTHRTDALDIVEHRSQPRAAPQLDRKSVV